MSNKNKNKHQKTKSKNRFKKIKIKDRIKDTENKQQLNFLNPVNASGVFVENSGLGIIGDLDTQSAFINKDFRSNTLFKKR